jgi:hypothetical protein
MRPRNAAAAAAGVAVAGLGLALALGAAQAQDLPGWCRYTVLDVPRGAPQFEDHAVPREAIRHPAPLRLGDGADARMFRTRLRAAVAEAARHGPNFAGHYALATWGCGTGCLNWGVVDLRTGKASFAPAMRSLENDSIDFERDDAVKAYAGRHRATYEFGVLLYSAHSDLLVATGAPNEDERRDGAAYYRWTGTRFERLAFYPARKLCRKPKD